MVFVAALTRLGVSGVPAALGVEAGGALFFFRGGEGEVEEAEGDGEGEALSSESELASDGTNSETGKNQNFRKQLQS